MTVKVVITFDNADDEVQALAIRKWVEDAMPVGLVNPPVAVVLTQRPERH